jgi:hypothetical protein
MGNVIVCMAKIRYGKPNTGYLTERCERLAKQLIKSKEERMDRTIENKIIDMKATIDESKQKLIELERILEKEEAWQVGDCVIAAAGPAMICRRVGVDGDSCFFVYADGGLSCGSWCDVSEMQKVYKGCERITFKEWAESRKE